MSPEAALSLLVLAFVLGLVLGVIVLALSEMRG